MRVAIYARVSREEQVQGYSIDEQLRAMRRFCQERSWEVVGEFTEEGVTGRITERPELQKVLALAKARAVDIVLTHQLDRFYRNLRLQLETLGLLGEWGVGYLSTTEQIDYSTPQGMLFMQMLGAFNEYYVANLAREVKKGKRGRAQKGLSNSPVPPLGYIRDENGRDMVDLEPAATVKKLYELYATGLYSYIELARMMNQEGRPAHIRCKGRWQWNSVQKVLSNPFYVGMVRYRDNVYPGQHEPIIDRELWEKVQAVRAERSGTRLRKPQKNIYLLQGIARCSRCGSPIYCQSHASTRHYYECSSLKQGIACEARYTRVEPVDDHLGAIIGRLSLPDDLQAEILAEADAGRDETDKANQRRAVQGQLRRLKELYVEGDFERAEYDRRKRQLEAHLAGLRDLEPSTVEASARYLAQLARFWAVSGPEERHDIVHTLFRSVLVDVLAGRVVCVEPQADFLPLFEKIMTERDGCFYE